MASSRSAIGALLGLSLVWGSTWIANGMLVEEASPIRIAILRYGIAGLFLAALYGCQRLRRQQRRGPRSKIAKEARVAAFGLATAPDPRILNEATSSSDPRWLSVSAALGCTMFALPDLLLVWAARHGAAPWTPLIYAGLPLALQLAAGKLQTPAIAGVGAMLVLLNGSLPLTAVKIGWTLLIVGAVGLQGWSLVYARRHRRVASSLRGVMVQLFAAAALLQLTALLWPETAGFPHFTEWSVASLGTLCLLAVFATALAYPIYFGLLAQLEPAQLAVSLWLQTLVAVAQSSWLLHQGPSGMMCVAACILIASAALTLGKQHESGTLLHLS